MAQFFVQVASRLPNGSQGPGFNLTVEAASYTDALEQAKPAVLQGLKDSGLVQAPPTAPAPAPPSPPAG